MQLTKKQKSEGWRIVKFGDVAQECKEKVNRENNPFERYITGGDMDSESLIIRRWGLFGDDYVGPAFHRIFRKGQILYGSRRTYLKKVAIAHFDGITANTTFVIERKTDSPMMDGLLPYLMLSEMFTNHSVKNSKGSTNPYILWSDIAKFEFPLPPHNQQEKSLKVLNSIENNIKIAKEYLNQGLVFLNTAISNTITELKHDSQRMTLNDLGEFYSGLKGKKGSDFKSGESFFIPYTNVFENFSIDLENIKKVNIYPDEKQNEVIYGDIIFTISSETPGDVGMSSVLIESPTFPLYLNSFCVGFRPNNDIICPQFSKFFFRSIYFRKKTYALSQGSTRFNISKRELGKVEVSIPSIKQQVIVAEILNEIVNLIEISKMKINYLNKLKRKILMRFVND